MKKFLVLALGSAVSLFLAAACGEVPMKRALSDSVQKIAIPPIENKTGQPDVDQKLTQKMVQAFIVDGRLKVSGKEDADVVLQSTLQRYDRIVLLRDANQVPQQYKLQIVVDLDFIEAKTGKLLWTTRRTLDLTPEPGKAQGVEGAEWDSANVRSLREFTFYYVINSLGMPPEDENVAADRVIDQMARRVVRRVIEGF
jgi:hypothetical protein